MIKCPRPCSDIEYKLSLTEHSNPPGNLRDQTGYQNNFIIEAEKTQSVEVYYDLGLKS